MNALVFKVLFFIKNSIYVQDNRAATAIEYALMATAIALGIIALVFSVGDTVEGMFTDVDAEMTANL